MLASDIVKIKQKVVDLEVFAFWWGFRQRRPLVGNVIFCSLLVDSKAKHFGRLGLFGHLGHSFEKARVLPKTHLSEHTALQ